MILAEKGGGPIKIVGKTIQMEDETVQEINFHFFTILIGLDMEEPPSK